jgi:putative methyltransferase (TIGR04325 family)
MRGIYRALRWILSFPGVRFVVRLAYRPYFAKASGKRRLFSGVYPTFEAARTAAPRSKPADYDDSAYGYVTNHNFVNPSDYPILYWLSQVIPPCTSLADFGGNVGMAYYSFRKYLPLPRDFRWIVYDLPYIVEAGKKVRETEEHREQLSFTTDLEQLNGVEIFYAAGCLQYVQEPLSTILLKLTHKPKHLLLNKLPISQTSAYYTLQNTGTAFCPYRVLNHQELVQSLSTLGYGLVDLWTNPDMPLIIPDAVTYSLRAFSGMYFKLR